MMSCGHNLSNASIFEMLPAHVSQPTGLSLLFVSRNPFLAVVVICVAVPQTTTKPTTTTSTTVKIPVEEITTTSPTTKTKAEVSAPGKFCACHMLTKRSKVNVLQSNSIVLIFSSFLHILLLLLPFHGE